MGSLVSTLVGSPPPLAPIDIVEAEIVSWRALLDRADIEIAALRLAVARKSDTEDTLRRQLATVGFAAVGNRAALAVKPGEPGHSHALVDVVRLRADWERLRDAARKAPVYHVGIDPAVDGSERTAVYGEGNGI